MTLVDTTTGEVVTRSLGECEVVIARGLGTFVEVGKALMEIRDARLYRQTHSDFDSYCRERWGFTRRRAGQLIEAADVVNELGTIVPSSDDIGASDVGTMVPSSQSNQVVGEISPTGSPQPTTESQARALSPLRHDPEAMAEVMDQVTSEAAAAAARVTANRIADKVADKLSAAPLEMSDPVRRLIEADPDLGRLRHLANAAKAGQQARRLYVFDAVALAELNDPITHESVRLLRETAEQWFDKYEKARPTGLRAVNGGAK